MAYRITDVECYQNYFLILAMDPATGVIYRWERHNGLERGRDRRELLPMLKGNVTVTFNGLCYDWWMITAYIQRYTNEDLYHLSTYLVSAHNAHWNVEREFGLRGVRSQHIDLMPVAPLIAGLKIYGGRINAPKLQDLPVAPHKQISEAMRDEMLPYCKNDLYLTERLRQALLPQLKLRRSMSKTTGLELINKSDAQIAEAVIRDQLRKRGGDPHRPERVDEMSFYDPPDCIQFESDVLNEVVETVSKTPFVLGKNGNLLCPKEVRRPIEFRGRMYQMGIGGLHSQEKAQSIRILSGESLTDLDVTSYYPNLILTNKLYPEHLGPRFLKVYQGIVSARIKAKSQGDKVRADALKIVVNSSFGKFGNRYSALYSPKLLLQTTISGQLYLLMLIEMIYLKSYCKVVSANTDGITVFSPNPLARERLGTVYREWEQRTGMNLEPVEYKATYSQDVNNYVAVKLDGSTKGKGVFGKPSLSKNPNAPIIQKAAIAWLSEGRDVYETLHQCKDIRQFVILRRVTGGALHHDNDVGGTVRWYHSTNGSPLLYLKNRNRVPNAGKATLVNDLPKRFPRDIDYDEYASQVNALIEAVGSGTTMLMTC